MKLYLNKKNPSYQKQLDELRRMAADSGHPRGVFFFKTFEEFNDFKEIFCKKAPDSNLPIPNSSRQSIRE